MKIFFLIICFSLLFISCNENTTNPTKIINDNVEVTNSLKKTEWVGSPMYAWDTVTEDMGYFGVITYPAPNLSFQFNNYSYSLDWQFNSDVVIVKVNGTSCLSFTYNPFTGWMTSPIFNFDDKNMRIRLNIAVSGYSYNGDYNNHWQPKDAEVEIEETYIEPPTSFAVSPLMHNNLNQTVSLSWNSSSDTDVTGYEIFRRKYYLFRGRLRISSYSLVKTIASRTTSSWQESRLFGSSSHLAIGYEYKIRSISTTLNSNSGYSPQHLSYLEDYDNYMP